MGCNALSIVKLGLLMCHLLMHTNPKLKIIIQDNDWFHQVRLLTNHVLYCTGNSLLCCQILRQYLVSMFLYCEHLFLILSCSSMRYVKPCESAHHGLSPDAPLKYEHMEKVDTICLIGIAYQLLKEAANR